MSATLGGLLKDLRLQKDIPQTDLAYSLGWKEASRISRIEQGKVEKPNRNLLESIMNALNLSEEERNTLYYTGNYLPNQYDIDTVMEKIKPIVDEWPYPASFRDYTWRVIYSNKLHHILFKVPEETQKQRKKNYPRIIENIFDQNSPFSNHNSSKVSQDEIDFFKRVVLIFQYKQKNRINERWYQDLLKKMMNNDLFRKIWLEVQQNPSPDIDVTRCGNKINLHNISTDEQDLKMYFFVSPVFKDPRFEIEFYIPTDLQTYKYFT